MQKIKSLFPIILSNRRIRSSKEEKEISNQIIETAFSCIANLFPPYLRACTEQGFLVKGFSGLFKLALNKVLVAIQVYDHV